MSKKKILVIDDDPYICKLLENFLKKEGFVIKTSFTGKNGLQLVKEEPFDLVLLDYRLPDGDGITLLKSIRKVTASLPVIIITAYANVNSAVKLIKAGAFDYVTKPIRPEEILSLIKQALRRRKKGSARRDFEKNFIIGQSTSMIKIMELAEVVAPTDMTVLIVGETGTGKEYISQAIHYKSKRKEQPFVAVDCGAIPHELANSELFGHVKGAFTGAIKDKKGSFEAAHNGTLFLDEIGNLPYEVQVKMLRVIQERTVNRVGENRDIHIDVRIIAASNEPLVNMVEKNEFREDLYHRLNEFKIEVPPLRERYEDIVTYADHFRELSNEELGKSVEKFSKEAVNILKDYEWLGNLRELKNVVKRAVLLCDSKTIQAEHFPEELKHTSLKGTPHRNNHFSGTLKEVTQQAEKNAILEALKKTNYNKSEAAKMLEVDRKTLYNKITRYNISLERK